jgi:multidrug resistance efflux pump
MATHSPAAAAPGQAPTQPQSPAKGPGLNINSRNISVWMAGSVALLLIGMAVALFDLWFQSFYYVSTDNSFIEGSYVQIGSPSASQVTSVDVRPGELVDQGQTVATLKLVGGSATSTGPLNYHAKAPRAGVVVSVPAREGQLLTAGQAVVVLTDPESLWVVANLDEPSLKGVRVGQPAEVQITVLDQTCQGVVSDILPDYAQSTGSAQSRSRTTSTLVPVRLDFPAPGDCPGLHPGMSAYTRIKIR